MPRAKTDKEAREKLRALHGGRLIPSTPYPGRSTKPWPMKCEGCGHEWEPLAGQVLSYKGSKGCPQCGRRRGASTRKKTEEQAKEELLAIHGVKLAPQGPYPANARLPWFMRCNECSHEWAPTVSSLLNARTGCPKCGKCRGGLKRRKAEKQALEELLEIHRGKLIPLGTYPGGRDNPWAMKCKECGYKWYPSVGNVLNRNSPRGCPQCGKRRTALAKVKPEEYIQQQLAERALIPLNPYPGRMNLSWSVKCTECGYEWMTTAHSLLSGRGCRKCSDRKKGLVHRRTEEEILKELFKLYEGKIIPITPYSGITRKPWLVQCAQCGHEWSTTADSLLSKGKLRPIGCQKCASQRAALRYQKSDKQARKELTHLHKGTLTPLTPYTGGHKRWLIQCNVCEHVWETKASHTLNAQGPSGCPECAIPGFRPLKPAIVYYVRISTSEGYLYKIGITNLTVKRRFWGEQTQVEIVKIWPFKVGADAEALEQEILRTHKAFLYYGPTVLKQTGNDEIFTRDVLGLDKLNSAELFAT